MNFYHCEGGNVFVFFHTGLTLFTILTIAFLMCVIGLCRVQQGCHQKPTDGLFVSPPTHTHFVEIFKGKKGSVGQTLTDFLQQVDVGVRKGFVFIYHGRVTSNSNLWFASFYQKLFCAVIFLLLH